MANFSDALQNVLTKGLDAASSVLQAKYQASDPTPNSQGQTGRTARGGYPASGSYAAGVPGWVWIAVVGGAALLVLPRLLKR